LGRFIASVESDAECRCEASSRCQMDCRRSDDARGSGGAGARGKRVRSAIHTACQASGAQDHGLFGTVHATTARTRQNNKKASGNQMKRQFP
jgi:hypothetical protein